MPLRRSAAAPGAAALPTASASHAFSGAAVALRAMATVPRCTATTRTSGARRRQRQGPGPHDVNDQLQVSTRIYSQNRSLDRDHDGMACEKRGGALPRSHGRPAAAAAHAPDLAAEAVG